MNTKDISKLLMKHDTAITSLEKQGSQMMLLWRIAGATSLVVLGASLTAIGVYIAGAVT